MGESPSRQLGRVDRLVCVFGGRVVSEAVISLLPNSIYIVGKVSYVRSRSKKDAHVGVGNASFVSLPSPNMPFLFFLFMSGMHTHARVCSCAETPFLSGR